MKVKELIAILQSFNTPNAEVLLSCDEEGNRFETVGTQGHESDQSRNYLILYPSGMEVEL